ncbi:MAG: bifunctional acetate--CoA ligase family protein/GNAT family N-acetyltransferase [Bryobacteraceae bacterium]
MQVETQEPSVSQYVYRKRQPLDVFFAPKNVAVIGATETAGSVGRSVLWNLMSSPFGGTVHPVNPKRPNVLGIKAYSNIGAIPEKIDLAVIVTPATSVPAVIRDCASAGVKGAIVISAGFKEIGEAGADLERQILAEARLGRLRVIGPNCLGVMAPYTGFNATFAPAIARAGNVGFISQSGALCTAVLDWSFRELVGFSSFISVGSMLDVGWGDLIYYLGDDPRTRSIVIYMETIGDARSFLSAAREVALSKPIIVIKAGRTEAAAKAAASHTGSLAGSDEVLDAAFRRSGVLRVDRISDLFYMAEVLAKQPRPKGPRLTILTNAGGPGVLATDALIAEGGELAEISDETMQALNEVLPAPWSHNNPIDILGDADPKRYAKAVEIVAKDPNSDGLLVVLTPQGMTTPTEIAEGLKAYSKLDHKPILASWMGGPEVAAGEAILNKADIPTFPYPDTAARAFVYMWRYTYNLRGLYETPEAVSELDTSKAARVAAVIEGARAAGRTLLTESESKQVLSQYGIPTTETVACATAGEAAASADRMGFPVVLKLHSATITHKTDVGGVELNLADEKAVREAFQRIEASVRERAGASHFQGVTVQPMVVGGGYEIILGSSLDAQFGPVILFGTGGQLVEVFRDRALALPPLNTTLARRMIEQTRIYQALKGVRGRKPVDLAKLEALIVHFSQLVLEQRRIREIDINPIVCSADRMIALDARIVLHGAEVEDKDIPRPAIRPYPAKYISSWSLPDGVPVTIRPIRPEDEPLIVRFHETLSEQTVYFRYFHMMDLSQRVAHERLTRICFIDYAREMALVAERKNAEGHPEIIAVGRLTKLHESPDAEFAVVVSDAYHGQGLGREITGRLVDIAGKEGVRKVIADILPENRGMQQVARKLGFKIRHSIEDEVMKVEMDVTSAS